MPQFNAYPLITDPQPADLLLLFQDSAGAVKTATVDNLADAIGDILGSTAGAPTTARYILQQPHADLSSAQSLSEMASGLLKSTTATGVVSIATPAVDYVVPGVISSSGLNSVTGVILGRSSPGTGPIESLTSLPANVQDQITRVGTITSGTWEGDPIEAEAAWGGITGTLSSQTDLQNALDAKMDFFGPYRLILSADSHEITQDDLVVNYADGEDDHVIAYDPTGKDGSHIYFLNSSGININLFGNVDPAFFNGENGLVEFIVVPDGQSVILASMGGIWTVMSRCSGPLPDAHNPGFDIVTISQSLTVGTGGTAVQYFLSAVGVLDFPSIAAGATEDLTISLVGALPNDSVILGLPQTPPAGIIFQPFVSGVDTVTVRATNVTASPIDPSSESYRVSIIQFQV